MADATSTPLWFAGLTFVGGVLSGQLGDYVKFRRDKEARSEARKATIIDRRTDFQRETLITLQDEIMNVMRTRMKLQHLHTESVFPAYPTELSDANQQANARTTLLSSRVLDENARELMLKMKQLQTTSLMTPDPMESERLMLLSVDVADTLIKRLGTLLREIDNEPL